MKSGGYAILNLKDTALTSGATGGVTIAGTRAQLVGAQRNRKAVLVSGINVGGVLYPDTFGALWENNGTLSVYCPINGGMAQVHVDANDGVIIELASA